MYTFYRHGAQQMKPFTSEDLKVDDISLKITLGSSNIYK